MAIIVWPQAAVFFEPGEFAAFDFQASALVQALRLRSAAFDIDNDTSQNRRELSKAFDKLSEFIFHVTCLVDGVLGCTIDNDLA